MTIPEQTIRYIKSFLMSSDSEEDLRAFETVPGCGEMVERAFRLLSRYDEYEGRDGACSVCTGIYEGRDEAGLVSTEGSRAFDEHSRFRAEKSWLGSRGLLQTPVLDEYTEQIYKHLGREKPHRVGKVYLTHDVDSVVRYRRLRGFVGGVFRSMRGVKGYKLKEVLGALTDVRRDPDFTFPLLREIDAELPGAEVIYFLKPYMKGFAALDRPVYRHAGRDYERMMGIITQSRRARGERRGESSLHSQRDIGLHSLYCTYDNVESLGGQMRCLERLEDARQCVSTQHISVRHRAHYLRVLPPEKMRLYCEVGITDDFSMGFASMPGFRLGTTRPTRCIDPKTGELLPLILHPLTIMDTSLSDERYLGLGYEEAYKLCVSLIDTTLRYEGDVTLLFHNGSFGSGYNERLYRALIDYMKRKREHIW